jgi:hypothetical protein
MTSYTKNRFSGDSSYHHNIRIRTTTRLLLTFVLHNSFSTRNKSKNKNKNYGERDDDENLDGLRIELAEEPYHFQTQII